MTKREIFDKVKQHLLTQTVVSGDVISRCLYRGQNGTKCAVGCLITDEHYHEGLEELSVIDGPVLKALEESGVEVTKKIEDMLLDLQGLHDSGLVDEWPKLLEKLENLYFK